MEAEQKKKKGGKGLSILSGRDLFVYKKELFVDDADAANVEVGAMKGLNEEEEEEGEGGGSDRKITRLNSTQDR